MWDTETEIQIKQGGEHIHVLKLSLYDFVM